jgi:putative two-component system response regulator
MEGMMRALIVDDDQVALSLITNILTEGGYDVETARNGRDALKILHGGGIRLLITDWEMPEMNGIELCQAIRSEDFAGYVYVIMLSAKVSPEQKIDGINAGADNFIVKPVNPAELLVCLKTADRILSLETRDLAIFALAKLAESRDPETGSHIERVQSYARLIAQQLSRGEKYTGLIDSDYVRLIYQTSPLHDIGKVGIPDSVLLKPGKLNDEEIAIMRTHTWLGAHTLDAALQRFPGAQFLVMARDIAATHHEKFDGSGYPKGMSGQQIPLCGRIVALADVYDALTSRRVYKAAMPHERAREIILSERGKHFDPDIVDCFVQMEKHFISIKERLANRDSEAAPASRSTDNPAGAIQSEQEVGNREAGIGIQQKLEVLAITDELTGLFNRRHALTRLEEQWTLADRYGRPLTIELLDLDHFQQINNKHGRAGGDAYLRDISRILKSLTRATDTVCRMAGEEFLIIFPEQGLAETSAIAERIRAAVESYVFLWQKQPVQLTATIGIAEKSAGMAAFSELLEAADEALFAAKQAGCNAVGRCSRDQTGCAQRSAVTILAKPPRAKAG